MKVRRVPPDNWCAACDEEMATVEISQDGSFKLFWACGPGDREIGFCDRCFEELKRQINAL